ncbi:MAG: N-acetylglucosamine-6-phosphate deacetylase [Ilumatobacteraceae bacterium]
MTAFVIDASGLCDGRADGPCRVVVDRGVVRSVEALDGPPELVAVDGDGLVLAPGFVDLQINGGFGIDLASDPAGLWELGRHLPRTGVTAFQPTIVSSPERVRREALDALRRRPSDYLGAVPVGLHFEGPMLTPDRRGAHPASELRSIDPDLVAGWSQAAGVAMVTLAPELPGALDLIVELTGRRVTVALGHSDAEADVADAAVTAGASVVTHLFNAMAPFHHRQPGLAGVALTDDRLTVGVIVDGVHLDPRTVLLAWRTLGPERLALVTDAVAAMGMGDEEQTLGATRVRADHGVVRNDAGVLAGSTLTMEEAVQNLVRWTGCRLDEAVRCASGTPAAALGDFRRGRVAPGSVADLVLLDSDGSVAITICGGEVAHVSESAVGRVPAPLVEGSNRWRS